jgi:NitT/TauT family transport system substrate-binding protein
MKMMKNFFVVLFLAAFIIGSLGFNSDASAKTYKIAWSHYTGWEPWQYAKKSGILKKWADKYGVTIEMVFFNDYVESINQYASGAYDGCAMTNMDALISPAAGGVDTSAIIVGDFSNGNDGFEVKDWDGTITDLQSRKIKLVEFSVSHYLWARWLDTVNQTQNLKLKESDFKLQNVASENEIAPQFIIDKRAATVTWNPHLMKVKEQKGAKLVFDSSQIPGEIIDLMVVRTDAPVTLKKALTGAWYETMKVINGRGKTATEAIQYMAKFSEVTEDQFKKQLTTTAMFYNASEASNFTHSQNLKKTMEYVRSFSFSHGLYPKGSASKDVVGIEFSDRSVLGNKNNVRLRFPDTYMQLAAEGKL